MTLDSLVQIVLSTAAGVALGSALTVWLVHQYYGRGGEALASESDRLLYMTVTLARALEEAGLIDVDWGPLDAAPVPEQVPIAIVRSLRAGMGLTTDGAVRTTAPSTPAERSRGRKAPASE